MTIEQINEMPINQKAKDYMIGVLSSSPDISNIDDAALTMLAENYHTFITATDEVKRSSLTFISDRGNISVNPLVKIANDAQKLCMSILTEFGLTLKSRCKLKSDSTDDEATPLDVFLNHG